MQDPFDLRGKPVEAIALWSGAAVELLPALPSETSMTLHAETSMTLHAFVKESWRGVVYFTRRGEAFTVSSLRSPWRVTFLSRVLSKTVYNPRRQVQLELSRPRPFAFPELQAAISAAVAADDDIRTQFVEREVLLSRIAATTTIPALVEVLVESQTEIEGPAAS